MEPVWSCAGAQLAGEGEGEPEWAPAEARGVWGVAGRGAPEHGDLRAKEEQLPPSTPSPILQEG